MTAWLDGEWPWYVAGPLIGLFVPALLIVGNKVFGISSSLSHLCAAVAPGKMEYFRYDWRRAGLWNLAFLAGVLVGGFLAFHFGGGQGIGISTETRVALAQLGIHDFSGVAPHEIFTWSALLTLRGFVSVVVGGFLVGFGTAYDAGNTLTVSRLRRRKRGLARSPSGVPSHLSSAGHRLWRRAYTIRSTLLVPHPGDVSISVVSHVRHYRLCGCNSSCVVGAHQASRA